VLSKKNKALLCKTKNGQKISDFNVRSLLMLTKLWVRWAL